MNLTAGADVDPVTVHSGNCELPPTTAEEPVLSTVLADWALTAGATVDWASLTDNDGVLLTVGAAIDATGRSNSRVPLLRN